MEKDSLEKFVRDHRGDFDDEVPSPEVWSRIEQTLPAAEKRRIQPVVYWSAAAAVALILITWSVFRWMNPANTITPVSMAHQNVFPKQHIILLGKQKDDIQKPDVRNDEQQALPDRQPVVNHNPVALNSEFLEVDAYYTSQINLRKDELFSNAAADPGIRKQVNSEFKQIDRNIDELKKDMRDNVNNREVVEALIQNYRVKLEMLENILKELKEKDANQR